MPISSYEYHERTSYDRNRMSGHRLDWKNQPNLFKEYKGIDPISLPHDEKQLKENLSYVLSRNRESSKPWRPDINDLSLMLKIANGITAKSVFSWGEYYYRSAASAGALYPTEIYVASRNTSGLDDGLYHFGILHHCLSPIRSNDLTRNLIKASQLNNRDDVTLLFLFSAIIFRSSWKYRDRSYRYHLLDTGHVVENLMLALKSLGLSHEITCDFDDETVNTILGLDEKREVTLVIVSVPGPGRSSGSAQKETDRLPEMITNASKVSAEEIDYPIISEIHDSGIKKDFDAKPVRDVRNKPSFDNKKWIPFPENLTWPELIGFQESVSNRRSSRNFVKQPLEKDRFSALAHSLRADGDPPVFTDSIWAGVIIGNVERYEPGLYFFDTTENRLGIIKEGDLRAQITHICLNQEWLINASAYFLFMTDLEVIDQTWGPRGYRYAMIHSGRLGERLYLVSTAMGIGCCGIGAYYDHEAADLLTLNKGARLLYLVAVGPVKRL